MKEKAILDALCTRYPSLARCRADMEAVYGALAAVFRSGGKLLVCGNGGSAADAEHIVGELMKSFRLPRPLPRAQREAFCALGAEGARLAEGLQGTLTALALTGQTALSTAFANDVDAGLVFAQQVLGYGRRGDALLCLSTSGNAQNVNAAALTARALGMTVLGMTGAHGGALAPRCDVCIRVPETETYLIQELHLPIYHALCELLEHTFFAQSSQ